MLVVLAEGQQLSYGTRSAVSSLRSHCHPGQGCAGPDILHMRTLRLQRPLPPSSLRGPSQAFVITHHPLQFQVPHVDDVLHRLEGVPEANFSSMVQKVSAHPVSPGSPPPARELTARSLSFPLSGACPVEPKTWVKAGPHLSQVPRAEIPRWMPILECTRSGGGSRPGTQKQELGPSGGGGRAAREGACS